MTVPRGTDREILRPECGYWLLRLAKGAVPVPACIQYERTIFEPGNPHNVMERSPILTARINGDIVPWEKVWHSRGQAITADEYRYRLALADWAKTHAPNLPEANPTARVDIRKLPLPF